MMPARPESTTSASNTHVAVRSASPAAGLSSAWNMPNLATKPDSGGNPAIINAQPRKASPRKAKAPGIDTPTGALAFLGLARSEEHTSELQSRPHLVCRLLLEKKKTKKKISSLYYYLYNI